MKKEGKIIFTKKLYKAGPGSVAMTIPPEILNALNLHVGTKVKLMVDEGKYGLFFGTWNPKQQKKEE
ncbi:MAG: AbrB/MazE/SpoVT family DNA-binding domain-containing protein [Bacteroidales bacterium]